MNNPDTLSRRRFIGRACAAVGATGMLSALAQLRMIGALAADLLLRRIEGDRDPVRHIVLPVAIVARRSVAPPRRARPRATKIGAGHD